MNIVITFKIAIKNILKNKTRSILTSLGIIIGVCSVVVMVGIGQGTQKNIEEQIASMGTNLIMVFASSNRSGRVSSGAGSSNNLTISDYEQIKKESSFAQGVSPTISTNQQIIASGKNWRTSIMGVSEDYLLIKNYTMSEGYFFDYDNVRENKNFAVIGYTILNELFANKNPIGQTIRIGKNPFKIIGVIESKGQSGAGDQDDIVMIPYTTALRKFSGNKRIRSIDISCYSLKEMNEAKEEIRTILRKSRKLSDTAEDNFTIGSQSEMVERASSITGFMTLLLGAIAGVSLLVGGIGIMNIMLVSVTERTKEIGIRISVGARANDILLQFLIESIVLSVLGGMVGVIISFFISFILNNFTSVTLVINFYMIIISFAFSGIVGIFFGFYPAKKAANLNPIDALRYE